MSFTDYLRWLVWGWWHGESVSAFDVRRTTQNQSPGFQIGSLRVPRWLVWLLAIVLILVLIVIALRLFGLVLTTQKTLEEQATLTLINHCTAIEPATGRRFIAIDCLVSEMAASVAHSQAVSSIIGIVLYLLSLVMAFIAGWIIRGTRDKEA